MPDGRVLLTGASGLLGTWLRRTSPADTELVGVTHRTRLAGCREVAADLRDANAVVAAVREVRPSLVIHAAYAHDRASIVEATRHVVAAVRRIGADVLFVSTDAVFSGDGAPRHEDAPPDPIADYGRWKAEAERIVTEGSQSATIVRLPLIVSLDPDDHVVARIRRGAAMNTPTVWFDDEVRQPAAAAELAEALWRIVSVDRADRTGVWHLPGPERLSRYQIAQRVVAALDLDPGSISAEHTPPSTRRPRHIDLEDGRARTQIAWSPSPILC